MSKRLTKNDVQSRLDEQNRNIVLIGECQGSSKPAKFLCSVCGYVWESSVDSVLRKKCNCKSCSGAALTIEKINKKIEPRKLKLVGEYLGHSEKNTIECLDCGFKWKSYINNILHSNLKCKICSGFIASKNYVNDKIKDRNIILVGEYFGFGNKHKFKHLDCGWEWEVNLETILHHNSNCPKCAKYGFNPDSPATLYYIKINRKNNSPLYKIGITNRTTKDRFSKKEFSNIEIIEEKFFEFGKEAFDAEQQILEKFKEYKYRGENILKTGNTEIFNIDILNSPIYNF